MPLLQRAVGNQVVGRLLANHAPVSGTCPGSAADVSRERPGVVQRLVAQITAADGLRVDRLNVVSRPASPYSGTMGDHTTAFAVVLESVRRLVERQLFDQAVAGLWQLSSRPGICRATPWLPSCRWRTGAASRLQRGTSGSRR